MSPVAFEALIPLLRIALSGPGAQGVGQWEPRQSKGATGEEEGWERGSQVSIPGEAGVGISPEPLVENSRGFRCMQGLREQSVEPGVVGDRTPC